MACDHEDPILEWEPRNAAERVAQLLYLLGEYSSGDVEPEGLGPFVSNMGLTALDLPDKTRALLADLARLGGVAG